MGYELHITRADDWSESPDLPITREEWDAVIAGTPSLSSAGAVTFGAEAVPVFELADGSGRGPSLYWHEGRIEVSGIQERHIQPLVKLASSLAARLVGDDDEEYPAVDTGGRSRTAAKTWSDEEIQRMRRHLPRYVLIPDGHGGMKKASRFHMFWLHHIGTKMADGRRHRLRKWWKG